MKIVIDIPEEAYKVLKDTYKNRTGGLVVPEAIANGIPLPKEHGRLIDADALIKSIEKKTERLKNLDTINGLCGAINLIYEATAIIEAESGEA